MQALAVPGDDEQRVVDADADADHGGELRGELGDRDRVREQLDDGEADADAEQRGEDGQAHRQHGAERDEQDDHGGEQTDGLGAARRLHSVGEDVTAELDGEPRHVHVGLDGLDAVGDRPPLIEVEVDGVHLRVCDRAVFRDLGLALGGVGAHDPGHARHLRDLGEQRFHRGLDLGVVDPLLGLEHDRAAVTRSRGEPRLEQVERASALGVRQLAACREVTRERASDADSRDEGDDPRDQDDPTMAIRGASDPLQHFRTLSPTSRGRTLGGCDVGHAVRLACPHDRSRDRRHCPQPDRPRVQGIPGRGTSR